MKRASLLVWFFIVIVACGGSKVTNTATPASVGSNITSNSEINNDKKRVKVTTSAPDFIKQGESVTIKYDANESIDSAVLYIRNQRVSATAINNGWRVNTTLETRVGNTNYKVVVYKDGLDYSTLGKYLVISGITTEKYVAKAVKSYTHNTDAYTQGLEFYNGKLYESSGEYGKSFVQIMDFPSMKVNKRVALESKYFGEGLTILNDAVYVITWRENSCFILSPTDLSIIKEMSYNGEGWGITNDGEYLYMSDGSQYIYKIDPTDFKQVDRLEVIQGGSMIYNINEMEWIDGEIWANIYTTNDIVKINPKTGVVTGVIDASGLLSANDYNNNTDVLNGIAYDRATKKVYLTGKNWPKLFEVAIEKVK